MLGEGKTATVLRALWRRKPATTDETQYSSAADGVRIKEEQGIEVAVKRFRD